MSPIPDTSAISDVDAYCPADWPAQRLAEARGIVADFVQHPDSLIILACRAIAAHSPNRFVAPVAGTYLFGASLLFKINASSNARMRGRLVLNGSTEIRGSFGEISSAHVSEATALWLQTMVPLSAGDTVTLQGSFRAFDGYFAANHTTFWGAKIG